jgi:hypothetical protein
MSNIIDGYVIEFIFEKHQSLNYLAKFNFNKGSWRKLVREIPLRIKVLLVEEGMLPFTLVDMDK